MIWTYPINRLAKEHLGQNGVSSLWALACGAKECIYCGESLQVLFRLSPSETRYADIYRELLSAQMKIGEVKARKKPLGLFEGLGRFNVIKPHIELVEATEKVCQVCGWWVAFRDYIRGREVIESHGGAGGLRTLDLTDIKTPLSEVRQYLAAKYETRKQLHPRLFEETVGSVFGDLGYEVTVTAYSGDGGIDLILVGPAGDTVGVQVKRHKNKIEAHQIRELTGALMLRGITKGVFVTTSIFSYGALSEAKVSTVRGYPIELYDASRFLGALKIAQRDAYRQDQLSGAPFRIGPLPIINTFDINAFEYPLSKWL